MPQETLQNPTNSAENLRGFCADSVKLLCSYLRNYSTTSAERVSPFRGMILPCPQICPYPVNVFVLLRGTCLLCTNMAHKLRTGSYVCTYVHYTLYSLSLRAGDCKTTVSTYAAVIRDTTVVKIEALTCSLPVLLLDRSEIVLSPACSATYEDHYLRTYAYFLAFYKSNYNGFSYRYVQRSKCVIL